MLCQFWFYVFCTVCTVCTVCWSIWNQSHPAAETITFCAVPYECVRASRHAHTRTCDQKIKSKKMPNTNCKQAQPSENATQVCVCALPFATPCVFAIFVQRDVRPPSLPCVCVFVSFWASLFFRSLCDNLLLISWRMISPASSRPLFPLSVQPPAENLACRCPLSFCTPEIAEYECGLQNILV